MKHRVLAIVASVLLLTPLAAQTTYVPGFFVKDARSLGVGGTFLAVSEGGQSLYGNPAGFASKKSELTILAPALWVYAPADSQGISDFLDALDGGDEAAVGLLGDNGMGAGYQLGIGYVGKGLGLGLYITQDSYAERQIVAGLSGVSMYTDLQINLVIGLAFPVKVLGLPLTVGGNLRPFFHATGTMPLTDANQALGTGDFAAFLGQDAVGGYGLAVDLGASLELGAFTIGLAVRDLAPPFTVSSGTAGQLLGSFSAGSGAGVFVLTPTFLAGLQYHPDLGKLAKFIDPRILFEIQDPVSVIQNGQSILSLVHAGVEVKTLSCLVLRAGMNEGWFSAGAGLDLLFLEINAAVFTEGLGAERSGRSGFILETAIRL